MGRKRRPQPAHRQPTGPVVCLRSRFPLRFVLRFSSRHTRCPCCCRRRRRKSASWSLPTSIRRLPIFAPTSSSRPENPFLELGLRGLQLTGRAITTAPLAVVTADCDGSHRVSLLGLLGMTLGPRAATSKELTTARGFCNAHLAHLAHLAPLEPLEPW